MFCQKCGAQVPEGVAVCPNCQAALPVVVASHLVWSILTTLLCCLPAGIPAIIYAAQVNGKAAAGDIAGARHSAHIAAVWCWVSFGCGLAFDIIYIAFYVCILLASAA